MSLASWKREFYRTPADRVSKRYALRHSLKKWTGLLPINLKKHKIKLDMACLRDDNSNILEISCDSCALCQHFTCEDRDFDNGCQAILKKSSCPLVSCDKPYTQMLECNKVTPMLNLIKRVIEKRRMKV